MKRTRLWAGLAAAAAVATGVTVWAIQSPSTEPSESKAVSATQTNKEAEALMQSALQRQMHQDTVGAAQDYRRVLELDPRSTRAWYGLGVIDQQTGRTTNARAEFERALEIDPHFISALYSEATLLRSSDPERAIELMKRAVTEEPKTTAIRLQLGLLLAEKGRKSEAEEAFRGAVAVDPKLVAQVPEEYRDAVSR